MSNFTTKLNLAGLKHSRKLLKGESGQIDCLIIPIKENQLFIGEKGLYLDLQHHEIKNPVEGQTDSHLVKQSLPKEVYDKMSDDERRAMTSVERCQFSGIPKRGHHKAMKHN